MKIEDVRRLRTLCEKYELEGRDVLTRFSDAEFARVCNGIGPESFPETVREITSQMLVFLAPAAMIHDVDYHIGGGENAFNAANDRLARNGKRCAREKYAWFRPRRYALYAVADKCADLCRRYGSASFNWRGQA